MAKSETTKKLSSSFSMDNILGSQPEEESQQQPPRLGSTSPILGTQVPGYPGMDLTNHGQLSPSSSSVRSSCESPVGSSPSPPLVQPPFNLAAAYAQAWAASNLFQRMASLQQPQPNPLTGKFRFYYIKCFNKC